MKRDEIHAYSAYGYVTASPSKHTLLGLNGEYLDSANEAYRLGAGYRSYAPSLMRFQQADSWSPFGQGGINAYAYCAGDPVNRADPTGHFFSWARQKLAPRPTYATISKLLETRKIAENITMRYTGDSVIKADLAHYGYDKLPKQQIIYVSRALESLTRDAEKRWKTPEAITENIASFQFLERHLGLSKNAMLYTDESGTTYLRNGAHAKSSMKLRMEQAQKDADFELSGGPLEYAKNIRRYPR